MDNSWEKLKNNKKKKIPQLILILLILSICSIFVINNFDFFIKKRTNNTKIGDNIKNRINDSTMARGDSVSADTNKHNIPGNQVVDSLYPMHGQKEKSKKNIDTLKKSVELHGIKCLLADRDSLIIQVSLKLLFEDEKIKPEILLKRDTFISVIKKIIKKKKLSEIVVNKLRIECKSELNKLLKRGKVNDIEFIDFRPLTTL